MRPGHSKDCCNYLGSLKAPSDVKYYLYYCTRRSQFHLETNDFLAWPNITKDNINQNIVSAEKQSAEW